MTDRAALAAAFLAQTDWRDAAIGPLAGDASNRRYERLTAPGLPNAVLMDAPPEKGEDTRPFVQIATHLTDIGLSAPRIYAQDAAHGFLLIEDLGDDLFARVTANDPSCEAALYEAAADALIVAQAATPPPGLLEYGVHAMAETAHLLPDWYLRYGADAPLSAQERDAFSALVTSTLDANIGPDRVLVQRDYHAENLLWLPERTGPARVGLLDFQDAMIGPPAYDLASLLLDARRDVSPNVQAATLAHFISETCSDEERFKASYAACSAQRNMRILGVFARLCVRDGKAHYPDLMPRVWGNLQRDLAHPALAKLANWIAAHVPEPSPALIARIKVARHE